MRASRGSVAVKRFGAQTGEVIGSHRLSITSVQRSAANTSPTRCGASLTRTFSGCAPPSSSSGIQAGSCPGA